MRFEYEAEDDAEPVKVVVRFTQQRGELFVNTATVFTAAPPADDTAILVRGVPHGIKKTTWCIHPDTPELDWVEVILT